MAGLGERATRLRKLAAALEPTEPPYYVRTPEPANAHVRAPGWYMRLPGGALTYLGYSAGDAEQFIRDQLRELETK